MKVPGIVENGIVRPLWAVDLKTGTKVDILFPEVEIDEKEIARRREVAREMRALPKLDIRPLTAADLVREDRESH